MRLTIVIPALNEEGAIGSTIERTLAARARITTDSPVQDVEIIVVSDGSTDRTAEIAQAYFSVRVIVFESNRGYGAAIQAGFDAGSGDLVGFLDADGTCDPSFFAVLCAALNEENAAVALGSRLGQESEMPTLRRIGNRAYALILSLLSNRVVSDTASGMRVIRREVLNQLYPLPDGLNFTPAMSARVLMDESLTIVERPMAYAERIGESKLSVIRDGVRFLRTILAMTLMWRPARLFTVGAAGCLTIAALLAAHPFESWMRAGRFGEDMIYRLMFCSVLGTVGVALLSASVLCDNLHRLWTPAAKPRTFLATALDRLYSPTGTLGSAVAAIPLLTWLVGVGVWTRFAHGYVELHWSRVMLAGLIVVAIVQQTVTTLMANLIRFHAARRPPIAGRTSSVRSAAASLTGPKGVYTAPTIERSPPRQAMQPAQSTHGRAD